MMLNLFVLSFIIHEFKDICSLYLLSGCLNLWGVFSSLAVSTSALFPWPSGPPVPLTSFRNEIVMWF